MRIADAFRWADRGETIDVEMARSYLVAIVGVLLLAGLVLAAIYWTPWILMILVWPLIEFVEYAFRGPRR